MTVEAHDDADEEVNLDDVCWHSARLRMARMVEARGCDALVDHIVLCRATARSWTEHAVAIGRSHFERDDVEEKGVAWRLVEVMSLDMLHGDLDGRQIYSEPVFLDGVGAPAAGMRFDPERSTPVRQRLMTLDARDAVPEALSWFSVKIRHALLIGGVGPERYDDNVYLLRAPDFDAAFRRAIAIGRSRERSFVNMDDEQARWDLVGVLSLSLLGSGAFFDGVNVYSEDVPLRDVDRVPFDTVFRPEESDPAMTIG